MAYIVSFLYFSLVQIYILTLSFYLVAQAFSGGNIDLDFENGAGGFLASFFTSTTGLVLVALASTYGTYLIASILYLDPWHLITSSWAYFVGMPSTINILNVYAFCNWHDVSWGTKGSDESSSLPSAQTKTSDTNKTHFVEEVEKPQADIDTEFETTVRRALAEYKEPPPNKTVALDDSYKTFRTNLVLLWALSNSLLALLINNAGVGNLCLSVCCSSRVFVLLPGAGRIAVLICIDCLDRVHHANGVVL
jgi:chitin synthase